MFTSSWRAQIVWKRKVPCFYRGERAGQKKPPQVIGSKTPLSMAISAPIYLHTTGAGKFNVAHALVGNVMYLKEGDDGMVYTSMQLAWDPTELPKGLYPRPYLGSAPDDGLILVSVTLLTDNKLAWPGVGPIT